jgi:predicted class III extradiol MEMO1 family dioxygenase
LICIAIDILKQDGKWSFTDKQAEEDEHSLEMHLPYIRKAFEGY